MIETSNRSGSVGSHTPQLAGSNAAAARSGPMGQLIEPRCGAGAVRSGCQYRDHQFRRRASFDRQFNRPRDDVERIQTAIQRPRTSELASAALVQQPSFGPAECKHETQQHIKRASSRFFKSSCADRVVQATGRNSTVAKNRE